MSLRFFFFSFDFLFLLCRKSLAGTNQPDNRFGHSTNTLTNPTVESTNFSRNFDLLLLTASNRSKAGWFSAFGQDKNSDPVIRACNDFVDAHVAKALSTEKVKERAYVFMDELIQSGASHEEIRSQLLSMIVGGRDTGASTLSSMLWILARRPDVVKKIREELEILGGQKPTWDDLRNLKYLNNVLKESTYFFFQRYRPPLPESRCVDFCIID